MDIAVQPQELDKINADLAVIDKRTMADRDTRLQMPPPRPNSEDSDRPRPAKAKRLLSNFGCLCCPPKLVGQAWLQLQIIDEMQPSLALAAAAVDGCRAAAYVDTHCHLDMVLKLHRRRITVPSGCKPWKKLTAEEVWLWHLLGWSSELWHSRDVLGNPIWSRPWAKLSPSEVSAASSLGWDAQTWDSLHWPLPKVDWADLPETLRCHLVVLGESPASWEKLLKGKGFGNRVGSKYKQGNQVWYIPWVQLTVEQRGAAEALGWDASKWDGCWWLLPYLEWSDLSAEVRSHLTVLGETADSWMLILQSKKSKPEYKRPPVADDVEGNPKWKQAWTELTAAEQAAAASLCWDAARWDGNEWTLPNVSWQELCEEMRGHLAVLGESEKTWPANLSTKNPRVAAGYGGDWREWIELLPYEREIASKLGFSGPVWNMAEMSDLHGFIADFCGSGFEGCVAQGCDYASLDDTIQLALAHPRVFASFGCHPKNAWEYDDVFESRLLDAFATCGEKAVAWGECGLDYSSLYWGSNQEYRQKQREVFRRQMQLAIARGLPLVLHIRDAAEDALVDIRQCVPQHWKVHMHSFLGDPSFFYTLMAEYPNFYYGLTGTVSQGGGAEKVCRAVPLSRLLLETDSPCIEPRAVPFSHLGQIPLIARQVAELRGWDPAEVLLRARANARAVYGI